MPLYTDRFSGHMPVGDPRTPLHGAGGCDWPTVPPRRWALYAPLAWGWVAAWATQHVLLEWSNVGVAHDDCWWYMIDGPSIVGDATIRKRWLRDPRKIQYDIVVSTDSICGVFTWKLTQNEEACNRKFRLSGQDCYLEPELGGTGKFVDMRQVEFDATEAPPP